MPSLPYPPAAPLCSVSRSGRTESLHRGAVAVFGGGRLLLALGDVDQPVVCRSATKPLQLLPELRRDLVELYEGFGFHKAQASQLLQPGVSPCVQPLMQGGELVRAHREATGGGMAAMAFQ